MRIFVEFGEKLMETCRFIKFRVEIDKNYGKFGPGSEKKDTIARFQTLKFLGKKRSVSMVQFNQKCARNIF